MSVVRGDEHTTLICDVCGETVVEAAGGPSDVVWELVSEHDWTGSPLADGPHRCAHCTLLAGSGEASAGGPGPGPGGILGIDHRGDATVITCAGDIDVDGAGTLRTALLHATDMGGHVIVDLTNVRLIDSTGLGLLVGAHRDCAARGATLSLAAPSPFLRTVLRTLRLDEVLPAYDSLGEAVARVTGAEWTGAPGRRL